GSGPRHLVFSPDGSQAYATLELSAQVARFDHVDGTLVQRQLMDLAEGGDTAPHSPGAIHPSADGRLLYVSDRAETNRIVVYAIEENGSLREIQRRDSEGREPREFAIDPSGRFMLIANQKSDALVLLQRDPDSGLLGETLASLPNGKPSDVKFIDRSSEVPRATSGQQADHRKAADGGLGVHRLGNRGVAGGAALHQVEYRAREVHGPLLFIGIGLAREELADFLLAIAQLLAQRSDLFQARHHGVQQSPQLTEGVELQLLEKAQQLLILARQMDVLALGKQLALALHRQLRFELLPV